MAHPFKDVITQLERRRASIERALEALREVDETDEVGILKPFALKTKRKGKRPLSAEARARMAEGQQRRWAAKRAAESGAVKKATRKVKKTVSKSA